LQALQRIKSDPSLLQMPAASRGEIVSRLRRQLILELIPEEIVGVIGEAGERRRERRIRPRERPPRTRDAERLL
jgi:hypothetical protein